MEGRRVTEWSAIEDMALAREVTSNEYQILIKTKGLREIEKRRIFVNEIG